MSWSKRKTRRSQRVNARPHFDLSESPEVRRALITALLVMGIAFSALIARLWYMQILQGERFSRMSENNRVRLVDVPPRRGLIFDAKGRLLADNRPAFTLAVVPEDVPDWKKLATRLNELIGFKETELAKARKNAAGQAPFKPIRLRSNLSRGELAVLETFRYELPGVKVLVEYRRHYLAAKEIAHVIGYLGEINREELGKAPKSLYRMGDYVGRAGIERSRERVLHGRRGARQVEVDAQGRELAILDEVEPTPGHNLKLTIDLALQRAAASALGNESGAVVAMNPKNGQIYCLYSSPSYDQNNFIVGMTSSKWNHIAKNPTHPLKNRAISGLYPPGSTYKIVTAIAGLAEGVITPSTTFFCGGAMPFGRRVYHCWAYKKGGHGQVDLHKAIMQSCDIYFYKVGLRLGVDRLAKWARRFGLGKRSGIPLSHESGGLIPTSDWKMKRFKEPWQEGETLSIAIGQGFNLTTPLQLARMVSVVANGGRLVTPMLVKAVVNPRDGKSIPEPTAVSSKVEISPEQLALVRDGLSAVVNDPGGTARRARLPGIKVGGKTGTAQVVGKNIEKQYARKKDIPKKYRDHALFVALAPVEDPTIAVAVVVEHGGGGGAVAAPVARKILEAYFSITPKDKPKTQVARTTAGAHQ